MLTGDVGEDPPWCIYYADDVALVAESREELEEKLERLRDSLESRGLKISREKTVYMTNGIDEQQGTIQLQNVNLQRVNEFRYLGSTLDSAGEMDKEIKHRVQAGWRNWRRVSGVICDRRIPIRLKGKVHKAVVRPALTYGLETAPLKKAQEQKLDVTEMKMLRWMSGVTRMDRVQNRYIRGSTKVMEASKKVQESRLRWFGHLKRRENGEHVARDVMEMEVVGTRRRGRPRVRWKDCIRKDMEEKDIGEHQVMDRNSWRRLIKNSDPE